LFLPRSRHLCARALAVVALTLITPFALHAGETFFIPLLVSVCLSFVLAPLLKRLKGRSGRASAPHRKAS